MISFKKLQLTIIKIKRSQLEEKPSTTKLHLLPSSWNLLINEFPCPTISSHPFLSMIFLLIRSSGQENIFNNPKDVKISISFLLGILITLSLIKYYSRIVEPPPL